MLPLKILFKISKFEDFNDESTDDESDYEDDEVTKALAQTVKADCIQDRVVKIKGSPRNTDLSKGLMVRL